MKKENKKENFKSKRKMGRKPSKGKQQQEVENAHSRDEVEQEGISGKVKNHSRYGNPNWYFTDAELAEQATRFSFQSYIGTGTLTGAAQMPSIASIVLNPSVGGYVGVTQDYDPTEDNAAVQSVNLCARKLYSRLSANSGRTPSYQPQDVIMAILGIGEVLSLASHLRRVIGSAFLYSSRNRDLPLHIIKALGVEPNDFLQNLAKYRVEFNTILNMANKIPILANIAWFSKCQAIYDGIFADSPDEMAQMYVFVPASTWIVDETSSSEGTILKTIGLCQDLQNRTFTIRNFSEYLTILRNMLNALLTSTTYNLIYADIINMSRKQEVPLMSLELVPETYGVIPQYDEEVLLHIHNMNVFAISAPDYFENTIADLTGRTTSNCNDVFQDVGSNNVMYAPMFVMIGSKNLTDIGVTNDPLAKCLEDMDLVDFPYGNPDLTQRLEATRFAVRMNPDEISEGETGQDLFCYAKTLPDHYSTGIFIFVAGTVTANILQLVSIAGQPDRIRLTFAEKFRYFPMHYASANNGVINLVSGDLNYFTKLDGTWLKRLNSLCLQGLFELR